MTAPTAPVLVLFRDDLRLADNPALDAAVATRRPVVCLYVLDEASPRLMGGAARWWLAGSLRALSRELDRCGGCLTLRRGDPARLVPELAAQTGAIQAFWNRRYDPAQAHVDRAIETRLAAAGVKAAHLAAALLHEPGAVTGKKGKPFEVFTPFWRAARASGPPRAPLAAPQRIAPPPPLPSDQVDEWGLEPKAPDWAGGLRAAWTRGESGARGRLQRFVDEGLAGYAERRERPDLPGSSRLSPHLRFGEISPFQIWHAAALALDAPQGAAARARDVEKLQSELGWREFNYHLLHAHPDLAARNLRPQFEAMPWRHDPAALRAWQRGLTGYPIVDAGMRELWQTGWMHNRVRMVAASFLVKHLLIDWREGEGWFWDTLVDADPANNPASWQWVAGCGADAAPYFRVFNPVLQGERFDPDGTYVRRYVPELARLPPAYIHQPWQAPPLVLAEAGVTLGRNYPLPIVDHKAARARALAAFERIKR